MNKMEKYSITISKPTQTFRGGSYKTAIVEKNVTVYAASKEIALKDISFKYRNWSIKKIKKAKREAND